MAATPPVIMVSDHCDLPVAVVYYISPRLEINTKAVLKQVNALVDHPGRGRLDFQAPVMGPQPLSQPEDKKLVLRECTPQFIEDFWNACAVILDYFATFSPFDRVEGRHAFFYFIQRVQNAAQLPHTFWDGDLPHCNHSKTFNSHWEETLALFNEVLHDRKPTTSSPVFYAPSRLDAPPTYYIGNYQMGFKPWEQFLAKGSPGLGVPKKELVYPTENVQKTGTLNVPDMLSGNVDFQNWKPLSKMSEEERKNKIEEEKKEEKEFRKDRVFMPIGALNIVDRHTRRARELARKVAHKKKEKDENFDEEAFLADFEANTLKLDEPHTYVSLSGHLTTIKPVHPAPHSVAAPRHTNNWQDGPQGRSRPTFSMMDEAATNYQLRQEPFEHPKGNDKFWMWDVHTDREKTVKEGSEKAKGKGNSRRGFHYAEEDRDEKLKNEMKILMADVWDDFHVGEKGWK